MPSGEVERIYDYSLTDLLSAIPAKTLTTEINSRQNFHTTESVQD